MINFEFLSVLCNLTQAVSRTGDMAPFKPEQQPFVTPATTNLQDDTNIDEHAVPLAKKRVRLVSLDAVRGVLQQLAKLHTLSCRLQDVCPKASQLTFLARLTLCGSSLVIQPTADVLSNPHL